MSAFPDSALDGAIDRIKSLARDHVERVYEEILCSAQEYLVDNAQYNIQARIDCAERGRQAAEAEQARLEAENADLKSSVIAFCAPWAGTYAHSLGLPDGQLHPAHYDILEKCGARLVDFTRADMPNAEA